MNKAANDEGPDLAIPSFKQDSLSERVCASLREAIISGRLQEGDKLPSQEVLAERYGVSRTVIREAVNRLSSLGLLKSEQGRGTFVHSARPSALLDPFFADLQFERASIRELLEVRYYLERAVVSLAARRVRTEEVADLRQQIEVMARCVASGDIDGFAEADINFHLSLARISKNDTLRMILNTIREMMRVFIEKFNRIDGAIQRAIDFHRRILTAVEEGNSRQAEREMAAHIRDVAETLHQHYDFDFDF